jgi:AraC family transcriptional regulator, ethanolamine operon transcriptional activator
LSSPAALESFQKELLEALREAFAKNQNSTNRHFSRWQRQAKLAEQFAQGVFDDARTVAEMALESGVPERTLRTAFHRCYGLAPIEYLRVVRLHSAQQLLLSSCPDQTTVTQVAFELGFWDLGRFAGAYRKLFGELPSVTLRKSTK